MPQDQLVEIVANYAFEFARSDSGPLVLFWAEFKKFLTEKASLNSHLSLTSLAHITYVMVQR